MPVDTLGATPLIEAAGDGTAEHIAVEPPQRIFNVYPIAEAVMQTKIQKWGNSLGLRIPRTLAAEARVVEGSTVDLSVEGGRRSGCGRRIGRVPGDVLEETVAKIVALVNPEEAR